jgi:signal transduction histidine kinase|tara:strand:+ start:217 stop:423 length:207 start_codon:yes stop_codon:yes gene_type:complete
MSEELQLKIFEPFLSTKDKNSDSGLGLGLSTTKTIAESIGKHIECRSEESKGTDSIIDLPVNFIIDKI